MSKLALKKRNKTSGGEYTHTSNSLVESPSVTARTQFTEETALHEGDQQANAAQKPLANVNAYDAKELEMTPPAPDSASVQDEGREPPPSADNESDNPSAKEHALAGSYPSQRGEKRPATESCVDEGADDGEMHIEAAGKASKTDKSLASSEKRQSSKHDTSAQPQQRSASGALADCTNAAPGAPPSSMPPGSNIVDPTLSKPKGLSCRTTIRKSKPLSALMPSSARLVRSGGLSKRGRPQHHASPASTQGYHKFKEGHALAKTSKTTKGNDDDNDEEEVEEENC